MYRRKYATPASVPDRSQVKEMKENNMRTFPPMTLTVPEMAEELHISQKTAYGLVREPDFPSLNIGKRILMDREGLQRWIKSRAAEPLTTLPEGAA